jgi:hypothetical protein
MKYYVLEIVGDIEPELHGPFRARRLRDRCARKLRRADPEMQNGLFRLESDSTPKLECYSGSEL